MRRFVSAAAALAMAATMLAGCRDRNVSDREDGVITDPTVTTESMFTMPSTDTVPSVSTEPTTGIPSDPTQMTGDNGTTENTAPQGKAGTIRPGMMD